MKWLPLVRVKVAAATFEPSSPDAQCSFHFLGGVDTLSLYLCALSLGPRTRSTTKKNWGNSCLDTWVSEGPAFRTACLWFLLYFSRLVHSLQGPSEQRSYSGHTLDQSLSPRPGNPHSHQPQWVSDASPGLRALLCFRDMMDIWVVCPITPSTTVGGCIQERNFPEFSVSNPWPVGITSLKHGASVRGSGSFGNQLGGLYYSWWVPWAPSGAGPCGLIGVMRVGGGENHFSLTVWFCEQEGAKQVHLAGSKATRHGRYWSAGKGRKQNRPWLPTSHRWWQGPDWNHKGKGFPFSDFTRNVGGIVRKHSLYGALQRINILRVAIFRTQSLWKYFIQGSVLPKCVRVTEFQPGNTEGTAHRSETN